MANPAPAPRRYLVEVRGVLRVSAPDGDAATQTVKVWLAALRDGQAVPLPPDTTALYLRVFPDDEDAGAG